MIVLSGFFVAALAQDLPHAVDADPGQTVFVDKNITVDRSGQTDNLGQTDLDSIGSAVNAVNPFVFCSAPARLPDHCVIN